jgi:hypothetical protein
MDLKTPEKNNIIKKVVLCILFFIPHCSANNSFFIETNNRSGSKEILNYEYTNDFYIHELRRNHFLLNIEIDKPVIIEIGPVNIDTIYSAAGIRGDAIIHFKIDNRGKITGYTFRKRAGLNIDRYVVRIIKKMKIKPVSHRGLNGNSEFIARFILRPHEHF